MDRGSTGSVSVQLTPVNGFSEPITLSATSIPQGPVLELQPTVVVLRTGLGYEPAILRVAVPNSTAPGSYILTITAAGGGRFHSASLLLNATTPAPAGQQSPPGLQLIFGEPLALFLALTATGALLALGIAYVVLRRPRTPNKPDSSPVS